MNDLASSMVTLPAFDEFSHAKGEQPWLGDPYLWDPLSPDF